MTRRLARSVAAIGIGLGVTFGSVVACVDLFHSTDFETLCSRDPTPCAATDAPIATTDAPTSDLDASDGTAPKNEELCADDSLKLSQHACAWLGACEGRILSSTASTYGSCLLRARAAFDCKVNPVLRPRGAIADTWRCLGTALSCGEVTACLFGGKRPCAAFGDAGGEGCTADDVASSHVQCATDGTLVAVDACRLQNRSCRVSTGTPKWPCTGDGGSLCAIAEHCAGTNAIVCDHTVDIGVDCANVGDGQCFFDGVHAACLPRADADAGTCTGTAEVTCDGRGIAHSCVRARDVTIDCAALDLPCIPQEAGVDPLSACHEVDPTCGPDTCSGNSLGSCAHGKAVNIGCDSVGLGPCVPKGASVACKAPF